MPLRLFQVDAFADRLFAGNPAAVVPLDAPLPDATLQAIATENNLSETAFLLAQGMRFNLRWFTPTREVDLCGHATLATAWVLFEKLGYREAEIVFDTRSGPLTVTRDGGWLWMDFPADPAAPITCPDALREGLGRPPMEVHAAADYLAVFESEEAVRALRPDFRALAKLDRRGVIATAPGRKADFVSRFFAPNYGIDEDPVCGSAHCTLAPFWSERLGKKELFAHQVSRRGGVVRCESRGARVRLGGQAVLYLAGEFALS
jgi:predicted PhzF superfamily epimerase YddE/YHI9